MYVLTLMYYQFIIYLNLIFLAFYKSHYTSILKKRTHSTKEDTWMANRNKKRCPVSLDTKKMQLKSQ